MFSEDARVVSRHGNFGWPGSIYSAFIGIYQS